MVREQVVNGANSDMFMILMALVIVAGWIVLMAITLKHLALGVRARRWGAMIVAGVGFIVLFLVGEVSVFALGAHLTDSMVTIHPNL